MTVAEHNGSSDRVRYPESWSARGRAIWRDVTTKFVLNEPELAQLVEICRAYSRLDAINDELVGAPLTVETRVGLQANPLIVEARLTGALASKLLAQLRLPDEPSNPNADDVPDRDPSRPQRRGGARKFYGSNPVHLSIVGG